MISSPNSVAIQPSSLVDTSVIWLYGLDADGHEFEPIVPQLGSALTERTHFVFPHAPMRLVCMGLFHVPRY